jgi:hypothetical protein
MKFLTSVISRVREVGEGLLSVQNALAESDIASVDRGGHTPSHEKMTGISIKKGQVTE